MRPTHPGRWWIVPLLASFSVAGAGREVPVIEAVKTANTAHLRGLLQRQVDVNAAEADGMTALHWAAHRDDLEAVDLLIGAGANVNAVTDHRVTPLSLSCISGRGAVAERLLKGGADPNAALPGGETPLMRAARADNVATVRTLLAHGADVNAKETRGEQTPLMWAVAEGHSAVAQVLIESGADVRARSKRGYTPLLFATRRGNLDSVRLLLAAGVDVNDTAPGGGTALLAAVINGRADVVDLLLDKGADPNLQGDVSEPPFSLPGSTWGTPLHAVVEIANWEKHDVRFTVPRDFDKVRITKALLAHGADPNARTDKESPRWNYGLYYVNLVGATPFLLAAKAGDLQMMRLLLDHRADPLLTTKEHTTALMVAAGLGFMPAQSRDTPGEHLEAVRLLLDLGASIHAVNDQGLTALHGTAMAGWNNIVQFLADRGAKLDAKDKGDRTPLNLAEGARLPGRIAEYPQLQTAALLRRLARDGR